MESEVWLVRHGETEWSLTGQHSGRNDIALTPNGEEEARRVAPLLRGEHFDQVLCSTLQRARRTCSLAGFGERAEFDPELQEWDYGECTGLTREQLGEKYPGWTIWAGPVPGGESIGEIGARARRVVEAVRSRGGRTLIFSHGHFLRVFTTEWLSLPPDSGKHFALFTSAVCIVGEEAGTPAILAWNWKQTNGSP
ncbi:MAG TPA: histidine phosphatase family protein [Bryobacteraceae bacterium]|nr:histidine phosphatase family protein [Bryobacteraceae bacterium]